jgi:tetratricopeptide (TPR) repeat protein
MSISKAMSIAARMLAISSWVVPQGVGGQARVVVAQSDSSARRLGTVHFSNSGAPAAQGSFTRGMALLHSFEYEDAADAFRAAERADPSFALPYWFEAFTHSHLLWGEDDTAAAHVVLARLGPTAQARLSHAPTARERGYGGAIESFYAETDIATRTRMLADSMVRLAKSDPRDLEAAAFASLALQMAIYEGGVPAAETKAAEDQAIACAERVFRADSSHPGAAHYLIHIADLDPSFAPQALPAARAYSRIAPDAEHALHMPSHVFLPLGLWRDVTASNERSWAASRAWVTRHGLSGAELDFHSLLWLEYSYLQEGRWRAARALIDTARTVLTGADLSSASQVDARYAVSDVAFLYAAETGRWMDAVPPERSLTAPSNQRERSFSAFADFEWYVIKAMRGDTIGLAAGVAKLRGRVGTRTGPGRRGLDIMATELEALVAIGRGDGEHANVSLTRAADMADSVPPVGPPLTLVARELLGKRFLASGRSKEAADQYERALQEMPNRSAALLGLARARRAAGDPGGAAASYRSLMSNWSAADPEVPALDEARRGSGSS